jgi:hypothetical protein
MVEASETSLVLRFAVRIRQRATGSSGGATCSPRSRPAFENKNARVP